MEIVVYLPFRAKVKNSFQNYFLFYKNQSSFPWSINKKENGTKPNSIEYIDMNLFWK